MVLEFGIRSVIKNFVIMICVLCIGFLVFQLILSYEQHLYVQNGADQIFEYNFSALCSSLANDTTGMDADDLNYYNEDNSNYGYAITSIFSYTTYSENINLNNIILALDQMSGNDAFYEKVSDTKTLEQLEYLSLHLDSEELAKSVWDQLSVQLHQVND